MKRRIAVEESHDEYRERLLERRREVLNGLSLRFDTVAGMGRVADDDRAQISHSEFLSVQRNRMDYSELRLVEEALDRIASGDFGICLECDEPIAPKRLQAMSWARYCVRCQERLGAEDAH